MNSKGQMKQKVPQAAKQSAKEAKLNNPSPRLVEDATNSATNKGLILKQLLPYINQYRGNLFLFVIPPYLINSSADAGHKKDISIWEDIAACSSLGIGCMLLIDYAWHSKSKENQPISSQKVQDAIPKIAAMEKHAMSSLSRAINLWDNSYDSNLAARKKKVIISSWFLGQAKGVIRGKDMQSYGKIRSFERETCLSHLKQSGDILISSNLACDRNGIFYAINTAEMLTEIIRALRFDKLIFYTDNLPENYRQMGLDLRAAQKLLASSPLTHMGTKIDKESIEATNKDDESAQIWDRLAACLEACMAGVKRAHILPGFEESALLTEILTSQGCGMMISRDIYEELVEAKEEDIKEIKRIIEPWEKAEVLRVRDYDDLRGHLDSFRVIKQDNNIIACAALSAIKNKDEYVELECVVVADTHKHQGYGKRLLNSMEKLAKERGFSHLVVFTTQTSAWFEEAGFAPKAANIDLPPPVQCRNPKCLVKELT